MPDANGDRVGAVPSQPVTQDRESRIQERGVAILVQLAAMMRIARTHQVTNVAFQRAIPAFVEIIRDLSREEGEVVLATVDEYFYLNGVRLPPKAIPSVVSRMLIELLDSRQLGGIVFQTGLTERDLICFLSIFVVPNGPVGVKALTSTMGWAGVTGVTLVPVSTIAAGDSVPSIEVRTAQIEEQGKTKRAYFTAVSGAMRLLQRTQRTGYPNLREARRVMQPLVDMVVRNEHALIGLTALKRHDEYTFHHCVNVGVLSVAMGQSLGLKRVELADLGVVALLHDIGKIEVPEAVLMKPDALLEDEWKVLAQHPLAGAKQIARMPGLSSLLLGAMAACLQHHISYDGSGYPKSAAKLPLSTTTRIVSVADCFDALTAHRAYRSRPWTPFDSLQHVKGLSGSRFDPAVVCALVRTVGDYPAGTLVLTGTGHAALTTSPNPADSSRPFCRVLMRPNGDRIGPTDPGAIWAPMPSSEKVIRVLQPEEIDVDTEELLAA